MSEYEKLQTLLHQDGSGPSYRILNTERPVGIEVFIHDPNLIQDRVTFLNRPDGLLDVIDTNYGQIGKAVKAEEAVNLFRECRNGMVRWSKDLQPGKEKSCPDHHKRTATIMNIPVPV